MMEAGQWLALLLLSRLDWNWIQIRAQDVAAGRGHHD